MSHLLLLPGVGVNKLKFYCFIGLLLVPGGRRGRQGAGREQAEGRQGQAGGRQGEGRSRKGKAVGRKVNAVAGSGQAAGR